MTEFRLCLCYYSKFNSIHFFTTVNIDQMAFLDWCTLFQTEVIYVIKIQKGPQRREVAIDGRYSDRLLVEV